MTNKERYQRTFSALHASERTREVLSMEENNVRQFEGRKRISKVAVIALAAALLLALATAGYAADVGGIRRTVQIWFQGDRTDAVLEIRDGSYTLQYEDAEGQTHEQAGGGVAYDIFGRERPLSEEEIMEQLNTPSLEEKEDGSMWVYYQNQAIEITDKIDEDGVCYVQLKDGDDTLYMTVKVYGDGSYGYSTSKHSFPSAKGLD